MAKINFNTAKINLCMPSETKKKKNFVYLF